MRFLYFYSKAANDKLPIFAKGNIHLDDINPARLSGHERITLKKQLAYDLDYNQRTYK